MDIVVRAVALAVLVATPCAAQQVVGPLQTQNNLAEIARNGTAAMAAARSNIGAGVPSVNQPMIAPLVTSIGTSATTVFAAKTPPLTFLSIYIPVLTAGSTITCTGDGGATSGTASYPQFLKWPAVPNAAVPPGPIVCTATTPTTIVQAAANTAQAY